MHGHLDMRLDQSGDPSIQLSGEIGSNYRVEYASRLDPSGEWIWLTNVSLVSSTVDIHLSRLMTSKSLFYRSVQSPSHMVYVPPGTFLAGSPASETIRRDNERQHAVTLTTGFWMGQKEVSQAEYQWVTGINPSLFKKETEVYGIGSDGEVTNDMHRPVERVSWIDATNYCIR